MATLQGLTPIENPDARALVLGSMPGAVSLRQARYYAHPQNLFWPLMERIAGVPLSASYDERIHQLRAVGVALWDVIASCEREGSLDSAIRDAVANDFAGFFAAHPSLRAIVFNGAAAETTFLRQVPALVIPAGVRLVRLPSTSPANRSLDFEAKSRAWEDALRVAGVRLRPMPPV